MLAQDLNQKEHPTSNLDPWIHIRTDSSRMFGVFLSQCPSQKYDKGKARESYNCAGTLGSAIKTNTPSQAELRLIKLWHFLDVIFGSC